VSALRLLNETACQASAASAERMGLVRVVVAAGMDYQGTSLHIGNPEARCQYRVSGITRRIDEQGRQIAEMAIAPRRAVTPGSKRVVVPSRGQSGHQPAILLGRPAVRVLVDVEAMQAWRQVCKHRREYQPVLCVLEDDLADRGTDTGFGEQSYLDSDTAMLPVRVSVSVRVLTGGQRGRA